jgi:O-antigen ligase
MRFTTFPSRADTCARACAITLGLSIPISVAFDNILLGLILAAWIASGNFGDKLAAIKASPVAMASLMLFGLLVLGLAYGTRNPGDGIRYLGKYADLFFVPIFVTVFRDERVRQNGLKAFCGAILLSVIISYLVYAGLLFDNPLVPRYPENPGGFKYSITHGLLVCFSAFLFVLLARETTRRAWRIGFIALALIAAHNVLFIVFSRTVYLVLAVLMIYFFVATFRWRGVAMAAALGGVLFFVSYIGSDRFNQRVNEAVTEMSAWQPGKPTSTSIGMRMEFYRSSLEIVREHPLFGAGTGSFPAAYAAVISGKHLEETVNPHDEYLLIASQIGLVGLACLIYLFFLEWRLAARLEPLYRDLARGLVLLFAIGCLFNSLLLDHVEGLWFAWASGLLFAGLPPPATAAAKVR